MKNNNSLFKFLLLLNGVLSIFASCPTYPTIPTTSIPKTNPLVLTSASEGMVSLNPSLTKLSITMTVTLDEECPSDGYWELFTLTATPSGESETTIANFYIECDTFDLYGYYADFSDRTIVNEIFTGSSRTVNLFVSMDLESREVFAEANSADDWDYNSWGGLARVLESENGRVLESVPSSFDETTKLYLCSWKDGAESALACTVSRFQLAPKHVEEDSWSPGYLGDPTPVTQAFYPLTNGELTSLIETTDSAYFGDSASSPTDGSSPSWDSSNSFVQIASATEFLTLPIPSLTSNSIHIPTATFAFWVRITSIPQDSVTLFSGILEDGTTAFRFEVSKDTLRLRGVGMEMNSLDITLDTWQLISVSFYSPPSLPWSFVTLSVGDSKTTGAANSISELTQLQIGDPENSFIGDVSSVRILSAGAGILTESDTCSPNNAFEISFGPYALSCVEGSSLNPSDNKCYSSCPKDTKTVTPFTDAPFTLCFPGGVSVAVEESSSGLSGGAIAGIVIGSVAGVAMIAAVGYAAKLKLAKSAAAKKGAKAYEMRSPTTGNITTTTNMV